MTGIIATNDILSDEVAYLREKLAEAEELLQAISKNTANLWALVLNIPKEHVRCFSTHSLTTLGSS